MTALNAGVNIVPWAMDENGNIWLILQQKHDMPEHLRDFEGFLCGFGGGLEEFEVDRPDNIMMTEFFQALLRELREEFDDGIGKFFAIREGEMEHLRTHIPHPRDKKKQIEQVFFFLRMDFDEFIKLAEKMQTLCKEGKLLRSKLHVFTGYKSWYPGQRKNITDYLEAQAKKVAQLTA